MPEATCFLYINGKHLDGQYPISRILWGNIFRVISVVAKTGQLYSESREDLKYGSYLKNHPKFHSKQP